MGVDQVRRLSTQTVTSIERRSMAVWVMPIADDMLGAATPMVGALQAAEGGVMRCIILDGWHKGHMLDLPEMRLELHLTRPAHVVVCDCAGDGEERFPEGSTVVTYGLAYRSIDCQTALYSVGGRSDAAWRNVGTLVQREHPLGLREIIVDCHDDRAWK